MAFCSIWRWKRFLKRGILCDLTMEVVFTQKSCVVSDQIHGPYIEVLCSIR